MATGPDGRPEPGPEASIDELQADIERTREELGETVGALSDKLDVKTRAHEKVEHTKEAVTQRSQEVVRSAKEKPAVPVGAVVALVAAIGVVLLRRRRRRRTDAVTVKLRRGRGRGRVR